MLSFNFNNEIFRAYDIRGTVPIQINPEVAYFLGLCIAKKSNSDIIVGFDVRASSPSLAEGLINGIKDGGVSVINIGVVSTPMCYFALSNYNLQTCIMITGSHNGSEINGFKVVLNSHNVGKDALTPLIEMASLGLKVSEIKGEEVQKSIYEDYASYTTKNLKFGDKKFKIGLDAMNGSGGKILKDISQNLPFEFIFQDVDMSGNFEDFSPEPSSATNLERLQSFVKQNKLDFAFSFDGDADRVFMITPTRVFYGDDITLLLATNLLPSNQGRKVIFDVKSSIVLESEIKKLGGVPVIYKTGHSFIKQKLKEEDAILAGELSGHIYINDGNFFPFDDGVYTFLRILEYISKNDLPVFENTFKTSEIKISTKNRDEFMAKFKSLVMVKNPSRILEIDGIKAYFNKDNAAILARPSNTEEVIIARVEAKDKAVFESLQDMLHSIF
jgi:phosphomannomutase